LSPAPGLLEQWDHREGPRRRGEVLDTAILDAALAECWPNRAELVVAALAYQRGEPEPAPDTGSLREDVLALLRSGAQRLEGLLGEAVRGLMVETLTNPERTASVLANSRARIQRRWAAQ